MPDARTISLGKNDPKNRLPESPESVGSLPGRAPEADASKRQGVGAAKPPTPFK